MTAMHWLMAANAVLWLGLGLYVAFLARTQKNLSMRIGQWEGNHE